MRSSSPGDAIIRVGEAAGGKFHWICRVDGGTTSNSGSIDVPPLILLVARLR